MPAYYPLLPSLLSSRPSIQMGFRRICQESEREHQLPPSFPAHKKRSGKRTNERNDDSTARLMHQHQRGIKDSRETERFSCFSDSIRVPRLRESAACDGSSCSLILLLFRPPFHAPDIASHVFARFSRKEWSREFAERTEKECLPLCPIFRGLEKRASR